MVKIVSIPLSLHRRESGYSGTAFSRGNTKKLVFTLNRFEGLRRWVELMTLTYFESLECIELPSRWHRVQFWKTRVFDILLFALLLNRRKRNLMKAVTPSSYNSNELKSRFQHRSHYWKYRLTWTSKDMLWPFSCKAENVCIFSFITLSFIILSSVGVHNKDGPTDWWANR